MLGGCLPKLSLIVIDFDDHLVAPLVLRAPFTLG